MLEPYAMKVARTVPRGGDFSNKTTYLYRPYAALLSLIIKYDKRFSEYKVIDKHDNEKPLFFFHMNELV